MPATKDKTSRPAKAVPQPESLHKLSFGTIAQKREDTRTAHPVLPDPNGQLAIMATRIIERSAQLDALGGALEIDKAELKTLATPFYFAQASGKVEAASSLQVLSPAGQVLISFPNRYGRLESEAMLLPVLGNKRPGSSGKPSRWRLTATNCRPKAPRACSTSWSSCLPGIRPPTR